MSDINDSKPVNDLYRIGSFAKHMGVTPDFLKHYEQSGLIRSQQSESGYRYYRFREAANILDCMSLRNHGFTVREMEKILHNSNEDEVIGLVNEKIAAMERNISFAEEIIRDFRSLETCLNNMNGKKYDWWISASQPLYFLPHTRSIEFINDDRIYELLPHWLKYMPVVRSASLVRGGKIEQLNVYNWYTECIHGLIATEELIKKHNIPVNDVVVRIPAAKCLYYHFKDISPLNPAGNTSHAITMQKMQAMGLQPGDYMLKVQYLSTHIHSDSVSRNERFIIPLKDE